MATTNDPGEAAVPAGYRLGEGWYPCDDDGYYCLHDGCSPDDPPTAKWRTDASWACPAHAVELGALVPIEPPVAEPPSGARCRVCGHYETSLTRATERYAHCPACGRAPHWIPVGDGDVRESVPSVAEPAHDLWCERVVRPCYCAARRARGFLPTPDCVVECSHAGRCDHKRDAPVAEPAQPVCTPDCGKTYGGTGEARWASTSPCWDTKECAEAGKCLNPPPVPPGPVPVEELKEGRLSVRLQRAISGIGWLRHFVDKVAALEAQLATAERERLGAEQAAKTANDALEHYRQRAEAAETDLALSQLPRDELVALIKETNESDPNGKCLHCQQLIPKATRDHWRDCEKHPARAEVEQLKAQLAEADKDAKEWENAAIANETAADTRVLAVEREADARVLAMRTECAKAVRSLRANPCIFCQDNECVRCFALALAIQAIERLPTSTGTASGAGGDSYFDEQMCDPKFRDTYIEEAIKAAVDKANNRAADAFHAYHFNDQAFDSMDAADFEEWLRSGADAPGAVSK